MDIDTYYELKILHFFSEETRDYRENPYPRFPEEKPEEEDKNEN